MLRSLFTIAATIVTVLCITGAVSAETVVITSETLQGEFEKYAVWKTSRGVLTDVVTVESIESSFPGRDSPEKIRNYLIGRYETTDLDAVLLGGDVEHVPVRYLRDYSWNRPDGVDIASDLYYAGLDGDWDANGNGIFGEPPASGISETDLADLVPELRVGRVSVKTPEDVRNYASKQWLYVSASESRYGGARMLAFGEVLFHSDWEIGDCDECGSCPKGPCASSDGAEFATAWIVDFQEAFPTSRLEEYYERDYWWRDRGRPNCLPLDRWPFLRAVERGSELLLHEAKSPETGAWSLGPGRVSAEDIRFPVMPQRPSGAIHGLVVSLGSFTNQFDETCMGEAWLLARGAGSLAVLSQSNLGFPSPDRQFGELFRTLWFGDADGSSVGQFFRATQAEVGALLGDRESATRFNLYSTNLLGDPDTIVSLDPVDDPAAVAEQPAYGATLDITPNPSRNGSQIRLNLPADQDIDISVIDVSGRIVEQVHSGEVTAGAHEWTIGTVAKTQFPSGIYYVRVQSEGRSLVQQKWVKLD